MNKDTHSENEMLKEVAPALFGKKHSIDTTPPEGYFDGLSANVMARIATELPHAGGTPKYKGVVRYLNFQNIAVAAAIALLLAMVPVVRHLLDDTSPVNDAHSPALLPPTSWDAGDMEWIAETMSDEEWMVAFAEQAPLPEVYMYDNIPVQAIEDYLIEEGVTENFIADAWY